MAGGKDVLRERAGRGASVGGDAAEDALDALVQQFSERSSFVRELIQNSLDAGAGRIEVRLVEEDGGRLRIDVEDDGEGMDRATIEGYLLTLFRSSKERDLTKIGKFGVGFVSLFALAPELVVVNTGRDGVFHRVLFDERRSYTLAEVTDPFEGTCVSLWVRGARDVRAALAGEVREAVHYWCRYARAEIWVEGEGKGWGWPAEEVVHPFAVDAPLQIEERAEGIRVVMGFSAESPPRVGYYNHGLTLLEADEDAVPGVTFRVEARTLEHTLTRDNVIRDGHYREVIRRVAALATSRLRDAHLAALEAAIRAEDWDRHRALLSVCHLPAVALPDDLACLRRADGGMASLADLRVGFLKRLMGQDLLVADHNSPIVEALVASGRAVLLGPSGRQPEVGLAQARGLGEPKDVHASWIFPEVLEPHPVVTAAADGWRPCVPARFAQRGAALRDRLVTWQRDPGSLEARTADATLPRVGRITLLVNVEHAVFARIARLPPAQGGPLLRIAIRRALALSEAATAPELRAVALPDAAEEPRP